MVALPLSFHVVGTPLGPGRYMYIQVLYGRIVQALRDSRRRLLEGGDAVPFSLESSQCHTHLPSYQCDKPYRW